MNININMNRRSCSIYLLTCSPQFPIFQGPSNPPFNISIYYTIYLVSSIGQLIRIINSAAGYFIQIMKNEFIINNCLLKMDGKDELDCMVCSEIALNAMETMCCGHLMCQECADTVDARQMPCPYCRAHLTLKPSMVCRRIINNLKVPCAHGCGIQITFKDKTEHEGLCKKKPLTCKLCSEPFELSVISTHMRDRHLEDLLLLCVGFHESDLDVDVLTSKKDNFRTPQALANKIKNSNGDLAQFGTTGKYYCGKQLIGKCGCCNGYCGPTNGENCDACMALDIKKYKLSKGFLVNPEGHICKYDNQSKSYYCGRRAGGYYYEEDIPSYCEPAKPCRPCSRTLNSIGLGRYKGLI